MKLVITKFGLNSPISWGISFDLYCTCPFPISPSILSTSHSPSPPPPPPFYPAGPMMPPQSTPDQYRWYSTPMPTKPSSQEEEKTDAVSRHARWQREKALKEDAERAARGEPPVKRYKKGKGTYICSQCNLQKTKETGHTQFKGKWFCPALGQTVEEWKNLLKNKCD